MISRRCWRCQGTVATRLGRYELLFRIAAGGMADVFAARARGEGGFEKYVAVKRILPSLADDPSFGAMFLDEGRLAANISSPHVVATHDLGRAEDGSLYLVMDLVVGASLHDYVRAVELAGEHVPWSIACGILAQAAEGLHDAHEAKTPRGEPLGLVHRDVSPHNILIDTSGRVRISDFGIARAFDRIAQTQSNEVKGKLSYFSPEQARGEVLDCRSDVYALGVVAWQTFSGRKLFAGESPAEIVLKILTQEIPNPRMFREELPAELGELVCHALERDRAHRPMSAGAFARALRERGLCASNEEIADHLYSVLADKLDAFDAKLKSHAGSAHKAIDGLPSISPKSPKSRGRRWITWAIASAAVAAIMLVTWIGLTASRASEVAASGLQRAAPLPDTVEQQTSVPPSSAQVEPAEPSTQVTPRTTASRRGTRPRGNRSRDNPASDETTSVGVTSTVASPREPEPAPAVPRERHGLADMNDFNREIDPQQRERP